MSALTLTRQNLLFLATGLAGCTEYTDRKDTVAFSAGNAVQTNVVTHVRDPWPVYARYRNIPSDGERMQSAVECYRTYDPKPPAPPSIIINAR